MQKHFQIPTLRFAAVAFVVTLASACGGSSPSILVPATTSVEVASVRITPDTVETIAVGSSIEFSATAFDASGAAISNPGLSWSSSDPTVATVTQDGLASAVSEGRTVITASSGGADATVILRVAAPPLTLSGRANLGGAH